jgi:hypothetical protein
LLKKLRLGGAFIDDDGNGDGVDGSTRGTPRKHKIDMGDGRDEDGEEGIPKGKKSRIPKKKAEPKVEVKVKEEESNDHYVVEESA